MSKLVFGVGINDTTDGINIQIYNNDNLVGSCYMVAYSFKEKIGRLVLRENIELNFKDINLKILIIGVGTGEGIKYQTIKGLVFDKNQDFNIEQQLTFTFKTVSDWERTHD